MFELHPRLAADTLLISTLELSELRLMNDSRFCWCILIPRREAVCGVHELSIADQQQLIEESSRVAKALEQLYRPDRINVAALGNLVPQLHWHVVARSEQDPCWPGPVWGCGEPVPYLEAEREAEIMKIRRQLETSP